MITIRRADIDDIDAIMQFLNENWKPGNIVATDRSFYEWQFVFEGKVNCYIAIDETGKIYGTYGYILYNQSNHPDMSGCTWQVIKSDNPVLGLDLDNAAGSVIQPRYVVGTQITKKAQRIEKLHGRRICKLEHYYRLHPEMDYQIAEINEYERPEIPDSGYRFREISTVHEMKEVISEEELLAHIPAKDYYYITRRYFEHPVYRYRFWQILDKDKGLPAVLITRTVDQNDSKCLRIVDYYGDSALLSEITYAIDELMMEEGDEYVDVYSFGVPGEIYEKAGFLSCDENCKNIIPNYFHPFERRNIDLITSDREVEGMRLFRGDGEQDRPG